MGTKINRWLILALGTAAMFFSGIIYAWSILKAPLQDEFSWSASQLAMNFTLTMCMFCIGGIISGILLSKISLRLLLGAAGFLSFAGFILASGIGAGGLGRLYLSYGILSRPGHRHRI